MILKYHKTKGKLNKRKYVLFQGIIYYYVWDTINEFETISSNGKMHAIIVSMLLQKEKWCQLPELRQLNIAIVPM